MFRLLLWPIMALLELVLYVLACIFIFISPSITEFIINLAAKLPDPTWYSRK
jgi:hypothetical protein